MAATWSSVEQNAAQLSTKVDAQASKHKEAVVQVRSELDGLRGKLLSLLHTRTLMEKGQPTLRPQSAGIVRRVEWEIKEIYDHIANCPRNESIWSPEFSTGGLHGFKLEFFPNGRESTQVDGSCALFLWCPAGVKIKYRLGLGTHWHAPDEDEYTSKMGRGHSNLCCLASQIDKERNSVIAGLDILSISVIDTSLPGMSVLNECLVSAISRESAFLHNRHMNRVEWTIRDVPRRMHKVPYGCGFAITSPIFSISGIPRMLLEFFPCGVDSSSRAGYCGVYVRCPPGTSASVTLFVGKCEKGPILTEFDSMAAKGLPEFCALEDQLVDEKDVVVGIQIHGITGQTEDSGSTKLLLT